MPSPLVRDVLVHLCLALSVAAALFRRERWFRLDDPRAILREVGGNERRQRITVRHRSVEPIRGPVGPRIEKPENVMPLVGDRVDPPRLSISTWATMR